MVDQRRLFGIGKNSFGNSYNLLDTSYQGCKIGFESDLETFQQTYNFIWRYDP